MAYALSPVDLIPDFIPVPGCLDDLLLPLLVALTLKCISKDVMEKHRSRVEGMWSDGKPER